ncbi:hypothetical protein [Hymenobacter lapidarius]|uniref:hypothetical protein n=1 Tax=Hymenobacter lapidarius TaxID=1908237 RepID=UPI0008A5B05A|nr:hypothetical protein [Hymenobacter lapidarius]
MEPKKSNKPRSPQINVKMTDEERVLFSRVGRARGLSISALARSLMHEEALRLSMSINDTEAQLVEARRRKINLILGEDLND